MIRQSVKTMINIVTVIHSENQKVLYKFQKYHDFSVPLRDSEYNDYESFHVGKRFGT